MNRNRVMRGLGLIALVMLAFGLAGCGSEPAPVARPPAPPPAPPPFQPQAVEVALGESGETVTLMTAEGGGFTLNGEAFAGGEVTAENGNMYLLALADDTWTAAFQEPAGIEVMLGDHGGTVIITMTEDGKYFIGEMEITADTMVMGENGQYYTPGLDEEGMWVAMHVVPDPVSVMLGDHGGTVMLQLAEDNTWWYDGMLFEEDGMLKGDNGQYYTLSTDEEGMWMAMYVMPDPVSVMLGDNGGTVMVQLAEDNTWWIGGDEFFSGGMEMGDNGHMYTLTYDMDSGMWMAMWVEPAPVMVTLGTSGSVELQQAEDLSWMIGEMAFSSGETTTASNGNVYTLTMDEDGMWSSMFQPGMMEITGTGLTAMSREDGMGYDVMGSEDMLSESGTGDITVDGAMYHVWMDDGMLMGARFDDAHKSDSVRFHVSGMDADGNAIGNAALSGEDDAGLFAALGYDADVETTVATEKNAYLKVDGEYYSLGTLYATGQADRAGTGRTTVVSTALTEIQDLRAKAAATLDVFPDTADAATLEQALDNLWEDAQAEVDNIFGTDAVMLKNAENDEEILDDFDDIIDALLEESAFAAATAKDGDGVFEAAELGADAAADAFAAETTEAAATFGALGDTRFGAVWKKSRSKATADLGNPAAGDLGAFAYSTIDHTQRTRYVRQGTGSAFYQGETLAVDGKGTFYMGDIEIQVRFAAEKVNGVITNLRNADGAWEYLYNDVDVEQIVLPDVRLGNTASWDGSGKNAAEVHYATRAGLPRPVNVDYTFKGRLVGRDEGDQGSQAVGVWSINTADAGVRYLAGGFGAVRGADLTDTRPEPDSGAGAETKVLPKGDIVPNPTKAQIDAETIPTNGTVDPFYKSDYPDTRGQTIADGKLKVVGYAYDEAGEFTEYDATATPIDTGNKDTKYRTHEIDLEAALAAGAAAWANGDTHVSLAKDKIEKQLRILESDIGLDADTKMDAWVAVQDALLDHLFGVLLKDGTTDAPGTESAIAAAELRPAARADLPGQLGSTYSDNQNRNFVDAVVDVLDALESNDNMKAALDVKGIFYRPPMDDDTATTTDNNGNNIDEEQVVLADKNGKGPGDVKLVDRMNSRVQYYVSGTDFTRFGAWHRQTSQNANGKYNSRTEEFQGNGPNAFAYSPLKKTVYIGSGGNLDNRFPAGARMTYKGDTLALQDGKFFEGAIDVEVLWNAAISHGGKLNMTISDIENVADGSRLWVDIDPDTNVKPQPNATPDAIPGNPLQQLLSISIKNVNVGESDINEGDLKLSLDDTSTVSYMALAGTVTPTDVNLLGVGITAPTEDDPAGARVDGYFVGQGLSGPLAVLGTWSINADTNSAAIGSIDTVDPDDPASENYLTVTRGMIHGAFGAEAP